MSEILKKWIGVSQIDETLIRLNNNASMRGRNQANSADVNLLYIGTDTNLHLQTNVVFDTQFASQNILISGSTSGAITMKTGSTVTSYNISWPTAQATGAGQTISNDSAGNLTWVTFMNNPMTTLGDTTYGGSAGAVTRLAGDTSNTRKFLRELSVTGVATAPVWDTLVAGDIPSLTATYATVTLNNLGTTAVNAAIVPASNGAISLGASTLRWQNLYLNNAIFDGNGNAAISTANKTLTDNGNVIAINWVARNLRDTAGANQLNWATTGVSIATALLPTADDSFDVGSASFRWANMRTVNDVWYGSSSGTLTHSVGSSVTTYALTWPSAQGTGALTNNGSGVLSWTPAGSGTVTSVSVTSANGFAGTVATATTTPAISISTTITGVIKGNGTAISAATAGTDYSAGTSALATGILKSTTTTGALTIAVAGDFPTLNQSTTGSAATVSGTNVVTNSNLSQMATLTIKGNNTGGTANAADLTVAQVNAILPVFTSSLNGLVPASGGGTTNFLRADGTWATTAGGGGANTALSNLAAVAINASLLPGTTNSINLGSATEIWLSLFTDGVSIYDGSNNLNGTINQVALSSSGQFSTTGLGIYSAAGTPGTDTNIGLFLEHERWQYRQRVHLFPAITLQTPVLLQRATFLSYPARRSALVRRLVAQAISSFKPVLQTVQVHLQGQSRSKADQLGTRAARSAQSTSLAVLHNLQVLSVVTLRLLAEQVPAVVVSTAVTSQSLQDLLLDLAQRLPVLLQSLPQFPRAHSQVRLDRSKYFRALTLVQAQLAR